MSKPDQSNPIPLPVLLVWGKPTYVALPQASWFHVEDRPAVNAAADTLNFKVIDIADEADRPLLIDIHEGVLKANGRMIVGSVAVGVYEQIEKYVRAPAGLSESVVASTTTQVAVVLTEQTANAPDQNSPIKAVGGVVPINSKSKDQKKRPVAPSASRPRAPVRDAWDKLQVGTHVLVKEWDEKGSATGWWVGIITGFAKQDLVIVWLEDLKKTAPIKVKRKHIAILHPSYDVRREWDDKN